MPESAEKIDFSDVAVILPVRLEHGDRAENFETVLRYFARFFSGLECIIVESDTCSQLASLAGRPGMAHHFIKGDGVLHKTWLINYGALQTARPFLLCYDADVLFRPEALATCLRILRSHPEQHFGIPYNLIQLDVDGPDRAALIADFDFARFPLLEEAELHRDYGNHAVCWNPEGVGGATFFRRSTFLAGGGYNKTLVGCYWDDYEIVARFSLLGYAPFTLSNTNLYHLHHHRSTAGQKDPLWHENEALYQRILGMDGEAVRGYVARELLPVAEG